MKSSTPSMPRVKAKAEEEKESNVMDVVRKGISTEIAPRARTKGRRVSSHIRILDMEARASHGTAARHLPGTKVPSDRRSSNSSSTAKAGISNSSRVGSNLDSSSTPKEAGRAKAQVTSTS